MLMTGSLKGIATDLEMDVRFVFFCLLLHSGSIYLTRENQVSFTKKPAKRESQGSKC